jgi:hypothetical protein
VKQGATKQFNVALKRALCRDQLAEAVSQFTVMDFNALKPLPYRVKQVKGFLGLGKFVEVVGSEEVLAGCVQTQLVMVRFFAVCSDTFIVPFLCLGKANWIACNLPTTAQHPIPDKFRYPLG